MKHRITASIGSLAFALAATLATPAGAQEVMVGRGQAQAIPAGGQAAITVIGDGAVRARPDLTTVQLGVELTARTPAEALTQTRERSDRVRRRLQEVGIPETDIRTTTLDVHPVIATPAPGREDQVTISGYRGATVVLVQAGDPARLLTVLTAGLEAGANAVYGLSYGLRDDAALRREALQRALADARPRAETAAAAGGLQLGAVRAITELPAGGPVQPRLLGGGGGPGVAEGLAPGEVEVSTRVQVTYDARPAGESGAAERPAAGSAGVMTRAIGVSLRPSGNSGVSGAVTVMVSGPEHATLSLTVAGLTPGATYQAQFYAGTPEQAGASAGRLGELVAGPDGRAALTVTEVVLPGAGATVPLTPDLFSDGARTVAIVAPGWRSRRHRRHPRLIGPRRGATGRSTRQRPSHRPARPVAASAAARSAKAQATGQWGGQDGRAAVENHRASASSSLRYSSPPVTRARQTTSTMFLPMARHE
jgi:uncharacterized protein YggE